MHPDAKEIFADAIELDARTREAFVASRCSSDPNLHREVLELLRVHEGTGSFMHSPTLTGDSLRAGSTPTGEQVGDTIGRYQLQSLIGEGGFGLVYRAIQREPLAREVALKIVKLGMDTRRLVQRFEAERQTLARLEHPNIATVYDAGATPTGRPYFVMELVKGQSITEFCDAHKLAIDARLSLFQEVCRAVQYAHQRGVIHRDIKPGNVLVAMHNGQPVCKIIDFGVAKVMAADAPSIGADTASALVTPFIGTPEYASPEQASGSGDVDTRSDVYALGVMLYELLTGTTPRAAAQWGSLTYAALQDRIAAHEPSSPSALLRDFAAKDAQPLHDAALSRGLTADNLIARVTGELDWIVLRAIERDPSRRYQSALDLEQDIQRLLSREVVHAAPPDAMYRVRKFIVRNKLGVLVASVVALATVVSTVAVSYGLLEAKRGETEAKSQLARANAVAEFLSKSLGTVGPSVAMGRDTTLMRDVLDAAVAQIDAGKLAATPAAEVELRCTIASVYLDLGMYAKGHAVSERAFEIASDPALPDSKLLIVARRSLGEAAIYVRDNERAIALMRENLDLTRQTYPDNSLELAIALNDYAWALNQTHKSSEALPYFREALALYPTMRNADDARMLFELALVRWNTGVCLRNIEQFPEAISMLEQALADARKLDPVDIPDVLHIQDDLSMAYCNVAEFDKAEVIQREVLAARREIYGTNHIRTMQSLGQVALTQLRGGHLDDALINYRECIEITKSLEDGEKNRPIFEGGVIDTLIAMRNGGEALPLAQALLERQRQTFPGDSPPVALGLSRVAKAQLLLGQFDAGYTTMLDSLRMRERVFKRPSTDHAVCMLGLCEASIGLGNLAEATEWLDKADAIITARSKTPSNFQRHAKLLRERLATLQTGQSPALPTTP